MYIGYTGFVPTIPKNMLFDKYEALKRALKTVLKTSLSTCRQKLKVPNLTGEQ